MSEDNRTFWFPAKRHGWGWGPPRVWQGWLVLVAYALLLALAAMVFLRADEPAAFLACAAALTVALVVVCWLTGEPLRWRSGSK
jgi:membrane protein YdbS with pleckstrin-like domain